MKQSTKTEWTQVNVSKQTRQLLDDLKEAIDIDYGKVSIAYIIEKLIKDKHSEIFKS